MTAAHGQGPPRSAIGAAMATIVAVLTAAGYARGASNPNGIELLIGERYLHQEGSPPRLILVRTRGKIAGPGRSTDGNVARVEQGFTCYLWGAESSGIAGTDIDATRYDAQDAIVDQVVNAVRFAMPGRAEVSTVNPLVATNVATYGEELQILVTYTRSVPRDATIWAVPMVNVTSPPDPMRPNGDLGTTFSIVPTTTGSR